MVNGFLLKKRFKKHIYAYENMKKHAKSIQFELSARNENDHVRRDVKKRPARTGATLPVPCEPLY